MDVFSTYRQQRFVWDSEKAASNRRKHGVSFDTARAVLFDQFHLIEDASTEDEQRDAAIGMTDDLSVLFVVYIAREPEATRIISARHATTHERRRYEDGE
jgi:uncharacterized DUF497 family protein